MSAREIRDKIGNVKNTRKITSAMELVAASKMRKVQDIMAKARPYATEMRRVVAHVAASHSEGRNPFLTERNQQKKVGYIVVSTDRGLCGGLNINLFRQLTLEFKKLHQQNVDVSLCLIGRKAESFFRRFGGDVLGQADSLGDTPALSGIISVVKIMFDLFADNQLDAVYVASNQFVNTMVQKPIIRQLLPLVKDEQKAEGHWDYIYEPDDPEQLLKLVLQRYIESQVYQAVAENMACEQSARMVAMKSATENAGELIKKLQLVYNKARQAGITREIAEIVGGAAAV